VIITKQSRGWFIWITWFNMKHWVLSFYKVTRSIIISYCRHIIYLCKSHGHTWHLKPQNRELYGFYQKLNEQLRVRVRVRVSLNEQLRVRVRVRVSNHACLLLCSLFPLLPCSSSFDLLLSQTTCCTCYANMFQHLSQTVDILSIFTHKCGTTIIWTLTPHLNNLYKIK